MQTSLIHWTPLATLAAEGLRPSESLANQLVQQFFMPSTERQTTTGTWLPAVDIRETSETFELYADLPGLSKQDVELTFENGQLTLSGERKFQGNGKDQGYYRIERSYGKFTRSFQLPDNIDSGKIKATFRDGVLTVTLPKAAEAQPRKVAIS